ncbi:GerW family sporulation protein [Clostridium saccharobutylicum]|uniref:Putative spore protein YtfJ n=1 Tax=Clostridium saccharobutylicum TaxID=169679 RepID=A0A1S8MYA2_CLOSA|nr:GerW family sporulation protein [Clostridium saccharobutylicum]OOM09135.1 putative spore protein YtfJ [Clostridium saccharobutylicum]
MANEQPVENLMKNTMENLRNMIDVNTVIGDAVETKDGTYIIPVSRLSFGFASGGSEYSSLKPNADNSIFPFGGGSGAGASVRPVAFLVVKEDSVRMLPVDADTTYDRIVDTVPQILDMIKSLVKDLSCKNKNSSKDNKNCDDKNKNCDNGNNTNVDSYAQNNNCCDNHNI